jgi:hypothetical protein
MPTPMLLSGTSASRRRRMTPWHLPTLRALTPARMKRKLKQPTLMLWNRPLSRAEVMAPSHLLGPALLKPTSPPPLLLQPAALPLTLLLDFAASKNFKFHQIPRMPGAVVRYTFYFPLVCYLNKFYLGLLVINAGSYFG